MRSKILLLTLATVVLMMGFADNKNLEPVSSVSVLEGGNAIDYPEAGAMVFRDAESWEKFWGSYSSRYTGEGEKVPAPEVDFSVKMLVGVFSGEKFSGGYSITIHRVLEGSKKLVVEYEEESPSPENFVTEVITYPCHILEIDGSEKDRSGNMCHHIILSTSPEKP